MYDTQLVERIKNANPIEEVVRECGIELKNHKALCPFHEEKHPSFSVDSRRQIAKCFACMPKAVDIFGFVMKLKSLNFVEAVQYLAQRARIALEPLTPEAVLALQQARTRREVLEVTARFYHDRLVEQHHADRLGYIKARGYTPEWLELFLIGLASGGNELRDYLLANGINSADAVEAGVLSINEEHQVYDFFRNHLIFPVMVRGEVVSFTGRALLPAEQLEKDGIPKWLHLRGDITHLFNEDALHLDEDVLLCEGASDTLAATMRGYAAVGVLGAQGFKPEYAAKFTAVKQIYGALDADDAGRDGCKTLGEMFNGAEKIIVLPEKQDLSDYFKMHTVEEFEVLKRQAKNWQETCLEMESATPIHLADTDDARYASQKITVEVMVCAKGETFHVPKVFQASCDRSCQSATCPLHTHPPRCVIPLNSNDLIDFTMLSDAKIMKRLVQLATAVPAMRFRPCRRLDIVERITIQELLVAQKTSRIEMRQEGGKHIVVDELGREFRDKKIFVQTSLSKTNQYFRLHGWVKANPKNQTATLLISKLEPIGNEYEAFQLTEHVKQNFRVFQVTDNDTIASKLEDLLDDITNHITKIYGAHRKRILLCMLLAYWSQIAFEFDGEVLKRGWVEIFIIGDTGQGKTQLFDNLSKAIGLGEFITGTSASRTGICYALIQVGGTWFLKWGKYPLNDGKLLFIDEGQALAIEEWERMSSGRSDGIVRADRVKQGERPSRTRLIVSANPKDNRVLDDNMCGVETLKDIFRAADIRRFDLGGFLSSADQSSDVVNVPSGDRAQSTQKVPPAVLRDLICWAWTRRPEHVVFEPDAVQAVYAVAKELTQLYGAAKDIPLVTTDIRHKVARESVALATGLVSTDPTYTYVIVKKTHVEFIGQFIKELFNHENASLDVYAALRRGSSTLTDEEYHAFLTAIVREGMGRRENDALVLHDDTSIIFLDFASNDIVERSQLAEALDVEPDTVSKKLKLLKSHNLIKGRSGKRGYRKTPKFSKMLKRMLVERILRRES